MSLSVAALLCLLPALATAAWNDGDVGADHMYNDLTSFKQTTNSTAECAAACAASAECEGWVFSQWPPQCGADLPTCYLKSEMGGNVTANPCRISGYLPTALLAPAFETMPVGSVTPTGWLKDELETQAAGLTGFLPFFWADIESSSWIGGGADGGLHERTPYWLNGLVPLSYLTTGNANLSSLRDSYLGYVMGHQAASGWIGIDDMPTDGNQYWGRFNVVLSLLQYYEASTEPKAITCIFNYLAEVRRRMTAGPALAGWAQARGQDFIMGVFYLVDHFDALQGVPPGFSQAWLIDLADLAHLQMVTPQGNTGGDWKSWFDTDEFPTTAACDGSGTPCHMLTHGVNIGQAIKSEAVWFRRSHDLTDRDSTFIRMSKLDKYHGVASGMFQADEHLAGLLPSHGTETCAVVEAVISYAVSGAILGDASLFERAERILYNAMPASMTKNMWERVYLQQSNEIKAVTENPHVFYTDGDDSATFSLEGNYGCCTANMHAGWPKTAQRAVGVPASGGVAVLIWMPQTARTANATVDIATAYPFGDTATVTVTPTAAAGGADVAVWLRIPSWAAGATLSVNGGAATPLTGSNGTFYPASTVGAAATTFAISFNPSIRLETYANGAVAVVRGALVYSAWIGQNITVTSQHAFNSQDLAVAPTLPWALALVVDRANPGASLTFNAVQAPSSQPFSSTVIPVTITGMARPVTNWPVVKNAADMPPASPACAQAGACGDPVPVTLVPFGSTHIRMTILPTA